MGGVGWGNNVHVTSRSSQVEDSWTLCSAFRGGMGGVGWGNNVHVTSRSSQVEDSWTLCSAFRGGWVGWGGAITFMSRPVHLKLKTPGLYALHSGGMGGVGWGNNVHVTSRSSQVEDSWTLCSAFRRGWVGWGGAITFMSRPVHLKLKAPGLCALHSGRGWVGWGGAITFMSRPVHLKLKTPGLYALHSGGDGWGGVGQ